MPTELPWLAVFLTGLLGGVHCAGMCGGIVSALSVVSAGSRAGRREASGSPSETAGSPAMAMASESTITRPMHFVPAPRTLLNTASAGRWADLLLYNTGRLGTYTALGALAGVVGSTGWWLSTALPVQQVAFALTNLLLILLGLYVGGVRWIGHASERIGQRLWVRLQPSAARHLGRHGAGHRLAAGALWGLVPCGMVYAVLSIALLSGSALSGALCMLAFGLGTLPNLLLLGLSGRWLSTLRRHKPVRLAAALLIIGFGLAGFMHLLHAAGPTQLQAAWLEFAGTQPFA